MLFDLIERVLSVGDFLALKKLKIPKILENKIRAERKERVQEILN